MEMLAHKRIIVDAQHFTFNFLHIFSINPTFRFFGLMVHERYTLIYLIKYGFHPSDLNFSFSFCWSVNDASKYLMSDSKSSMYSCSSSPDNSFPSAFFFVLCNLLRSVVRFFMFTLAALIP